MENNCSELSLSFVVPCYNVEKYIQRCLDSIYSCNLPVDRFEVICINDCSPDNVQDILEQNRVKYSNLRIIDHEVNKGLGGARNTGIREAKGKYLWFVDSDDEIIGDDLSDVLNRTLEDDLDVMCFNYRRLDSEGNELPLQYYMKDIAVQDGVSFAKIAFEGGLSLNMGYVVRLLYKTDYLRSHGLVFPEKVYWEDTVFMPKSILLAERVAASASKMYSYWMNPGSISGTFFRVYPAKQIFDFAFTTGGELLLFSEKVKDAGLNNELRNAAIQKYINGFPLHLFRTSRHERKRFYALLKERRDEVKPLKREMNSLSKGLLLPLVGPVLTEMGALLYKVSHRKQSRC